MIDDSTWDDTTLASFEDDLQNSLKITSKFGPNTKLTDLSKGKGLMSDVLLLDVEWIPPQDDIPNKFAIKYSLPKRKREVKGNRLGELLTEETEDNQARVNAVMYHNTEVIIYEKMKEAHHVFIPRTIYTQARTIDTVGNIIMEYVDANSSLHMCDNIPGHAVSQVLEALAIFHSMSSNFTKKEQIELSKNIFRDVYIVMFTPPMVEGMKGMIGDFATCENVYGVYSVKNFSKIANDFSDPKHMKYMDTTPEDLGCQRVLTHGDVWMCNMLWHIEGRNPDTIANIEKQKWTLKRLVDYQAAHFGCASNDLIRLFVGCISGKERREKWEENSEEYYGYLRKWWKGALPFTLEQLKEGYRRMFPLTAFIVAGSIGAVGRMILDQRMGHEKLVATNILCEKQKFMLEDIVFYHNRNKAHMGLLP